MKKLKLKPIVMLCQLYCLLYSPVIFANESEDEFDASFLRGNENHAIDISRFNKKNAFLPGFYPNVEVFVNSEKKGRGCSRLARMLYYKNEDNPL